MLAFFIAEFPSSVKRRSRAISLKEKNFPLSCFINSRSRSMWNFFTHIFADFLHSQSVERVRSHQKWLILYFSTCLFFGIAKFYYFTFLYIHCGWKFSLYTNFSVQMTNCKVCNGEAKQKCSGCFNVFYCSRNCQVKDWKNGHKNECKPYEVSFIVKRKKT